MVIQETATSDGAMDLCAGPSWGARLPRLRNSISGHILSGRTSFEYPNMLLADDLDSAAKFLHALAEPS